MPEYLEKLRPDRDLQCYFQRPSAVAALSETSASGFRVSGCWRQQFDWAVVDWTRDNIFDHPSFRNLPDGDLSGLQLSYEETRYNCMPIDAAWSPRVDWPSLRIWAGDDDALYKVPLKEHATPAEGTYTAAAATLELQGAVTKDDYVELDILGEHYTYQMRGGDEILENAVLGLADGVNYARDHGMSLMTATAQGRQITLNWPAEAGANGNRIAVYGNVTGAKTETWAPAWTNFSGGTSPTKWRIELDFGTLEDENKAKIPTQAVRKMRWTWAADMQNGAYAESEFEVAISNWTVTGDRRRYQVAGPGSLRIEDDSKRIAWSGAWTESRGNFSGGSIRYTRTPGASASYTYTLARAHQLYLGTRKAPTCCDVKVVVDGIALDPVKLRHGEDTLVRVPLGPYAAGTHAVTVAHDGADGDYFYFDFLEAALPTEELPVFPTDRQVTLATDWDTDHSLALAPERTAWMIHSLGFAGRANHYVGAMWWYGLYQPGQQYATSTITFVGTPQFSHWTEIRLGPTPISHLNLVGDTAESIAKAFELAVNAGTTTLWARAEGAVLTLYARDMGTAGNGFEIAASPGPEDPGGDVFHTEVSGPLAGGLDGTCRLSLEKQPDAAWCTDLEGRPVLNRAARDWNRSYFRALAGYGIAATAAFSMELRHGDPSLEAGISQRYPDGTPAWLNTPAVQTNFSPGSTVFWRQVYLEMAGLMVEAGQAPSLQFGEVQWWYNAAPGGGMPFYDEYTKTTFRTRYGREMHVFAANDEDPGAYPAECALLAELIGDFTDAVMAFVRQAQPTVQFEVLYPPDVNEPALNRAINLPAAWSPVKLDGFKTENFLFTGSRNVNKARASIQLPLDLGFPRSKSSHLVGIGEYATPWVRECGLAKGAGLESVVLFALDQFCLIGYAVPPRYRRGRSFFMGS